MIRYTVPKNWIAYDPTAIGQELAEAKAGLLALTRMPYQRSWAEKMQEIQLKREVAGTSRIEGAEFTERELDEAMKERVETSFTRSQKQAAAAVRTYRWIATLPEDQPVNEELILEVHRKIVKDADDDHCEPGKLRGADVNVVFGSPRHRGAEGGEECKRAFAALCQSVVHDFRRHDRLIQALALHYHFAAMHPFLDGNGRTARALEALVLHRAELKDSLFISMSNYYYEEKDAYLKKLAEVREANHDLTAFLKFGLLGIKLQCDRLLKEISIQLKKSLFRNTMYDLFQRLQSKRKRVMHQRQLEILKLLLEVEELDVSDLRHRLTASYSGLADAYNALIRDLLRLENLEAIQIDRDLDKLKATLRINLDWPARITETKFFAMASALPKAKSHRFL